MRLAFSAAMALLLTGCEGLNFGATFGFSSNNGANTSVSGSAGRSTTTVRADR